MTRVLRMLLWAGLFVAACAVPLQAADTWIEVKSTHFTIWSNASDGSTRTLAWQLEQVRSTLAALWPWARVDLTRPLLVVAAKDEMSMKALAPRYWEEKGAIHPVSVWVSGRDRHYLAIRTDLRSADTDTLNPYHSAYSSYVSLVLQSSFERHLPVWFSRGLSSVLSNTIVRENHIRLGMPIPWHLRTLQERPRMPLAKVIAVTHNSAEYRQESLRDVFDAQSWALVHFLMFGEGGKHRARFDQYMNLLKSGASEETALQESLGRLEDLEAAVINYVNRTLFSYARVNVDANVKREGFVVRKLAAADAAVGRASFHAAMQRPSESRALVVEARKTDPNVAAAHIVDGLLFEGEDKPADAKAAYARAIELGSSDAYAFHRWAALSWSPQMDPDTLDRIEKTLTKAVALDPSNASAASFLAQTRSAMGKPIEETIPLLKRAIELEPAEPYHRLVAARVYLRVRNYVAARAAARIALSLPATDRERSEAESLLETINRAEAAGRQR